MKVILLQASTGHVLFSTEDSDSRSVEDKKPSFFESTLKCAFPSEHAALALSFGADSLGLADEGDFDFAQSLTKFIHGPDGLPSKVSVDDIQSSFRLYSDSGRDLLCFVALAQSKVTMWNTRSIRQLYDQVSATILSEVANVWKLLNKPSQETGLQTARTKNFGEEQVASKMSDSVLSPTSSGQPTTISVASVTTARGVGLELANLKSSTYRSSWGIVQWPRKARTHLMQVVAHQARWLMQKLAIELNKSIDCVVNSSTWSECKEQNQDSNNSEGSQLGSDFGKNEYAALAIGCVAVVLSNSNEGHDDQYTSEKEHFRISFSHSKDGPSTQCSDFDKALEASQKLLVSGVVLQNYGSSLPVLVPRIADEQQRSEAKAHGKEITDRNTSNRIGSDSHLRLSFTRPIAKLEQDTFIVSIPQTHSLIFSFRHHSSSHKSADTCWIGIPVQTQKIIPPTVQQALLGLVRDFSCLSSLLAFTIACADLYKE